jgi:RNA polymerase sigma factor (sigma-70 family)
MHCITYRTQQEVTGVPQGFDLTEIYDRYGPMLFRLCFIQLKSKEDAEDAVQSVFMKLLSERKSFESDDHLRFWLVRVAINTCKNALKSAFRRKTVGPEALTDLSVTDELHIQILLDLLALPPKHRQVLYLYYYVGYSAAEIGRLLGVKESAVFMRLSRARKQLKLALEEDAS